MSQRQKFFHEKSVASRVWVSGGSVFVLLLLWWLTTQSLGLFNAMQLPAPPDVWWALRLIAVDYADGALIEHVATSTLLVLAGFAAAALTSVPLGLWMGCNPLVQACVNPVFQLIRPIAPIAWIPLTILWFGLGMSAKVFVIGLAAFAPNVINTYAGVRNIDAPMIEAARVHGAGARRMLFDVILPGSAVSIFTGLRTSLQACWMVLVAAEMVGSFTGLGHVLIIATHDLNSAMIVVAMLCVALMGMTMTLLLVAVERRLVPWTR